MASIHILLLLLLAAATNIHCDADDYAPTTGSTCIKKCNKMKDGSYQSCDRCDAYIKCLGGYMKLKNCKGKKVWDDNRKNCVSVPSATCTPILLPESCEREETPPPRYGKQPNFLYILLDDLGFNDIGYVNKDFHTPNIDTLASYNARVFEWLYMQPACTPSRSALMTGRYPYKDKMQHLVLQGLTPHCVPLDVEFLPEKLKKLGYSNHLMGKWHLGFCQKACTPTERGFDTFVGLYGGHGDQSLHLTPPPEPNWYDWRNNHQLDFSANGSFVTDILNDNAIKLLRGMDKDKPWSMFLMHTVPHSPLQAPEEYLAMFADEEEEEVGKVKAMLAHLDKRTGDLIRVLREEGFYENTVIFITSDNGGDIGAHHNNWPLRAGKMSLFEGGTRVRGFVHSPLLRNTELFGTHSGLMHVTDLHSTMVSLAGGEPGDIDGVDQTEMIMNGYGSKRTDLVYNIDLSEPAYFGHVAYRDAVYKIIWGNDGYVDGYGYDAVLSENYPPNLVELGLDPNDYNTSTAASDKRGLDLIALRRIILGDINSGKVQLYNLIDDPTESNDLSQDPSMAFRVLSMKTKILDLIEDGYEESFPFDFWFTEAAAAREQGAWAMGWCDGQEL